MLQELPEPLASALEPLFKVLPVELSMPELVVARPPDPDLVKTVEAMLEDRALQNRPHVQAGLWLYVDVLDRSHVISQSLEDATGAYWHAIMHRREGDFSNSHYWLDRAGKHPAADIPGYDPRAFVEEVARRHALNPPELVQVQRDEWASLFAWCAQHS